MRRVAACLRATASWQREATAIVAWARAACCAAAGLANRTAAADIVVTDAVAMAESVKAATTDGMEGFVMLNVAFVPFVEGRDVVLDEGGEVALVVFVVLVEGGDGALVVFVEVVLVVLVEGGDVALVVFVDVALVVLVEVVFVRDVPFPEVFVHDIVCDRSVCVHERVLEMVDSDADARVLEREEA